MRELKLTKGCIYPFSYVFSVVFIWQGKVLSFRLSSGAPLSHQYQYFLALDWSNFFKLGKSHQPVHKKDAQLKGFARTIEIMPIFSLGLFHSDIFLLSFFCCAKKRSKKCFRTFFSDSAENRRIFFSFFYNKMKEKFRLRTNTSDTDCERWSLYNSVFFSFTVMTTIGN